MINTWHELKFWETGEYDVVQERLDDLKRDGVLFNPVRSKLFHILDIIEPGQVRVAVIGQDPYPQHDLATGIAFDVPDHIYKAGGFEALPPTLQTILREYSKDLGFKLPETGNLLPWVKQGVLLWNSIPSCTAGKSLSHDWPEYLLLTEEIIKELDQQEIVFVFLGGKARHFAQFVQKSKVIETSHPSPRAGTKARCPFIGSRIFSRTNALLRELKKEPIDWRLS